MRMRDRRQPLGVLVLAAAYAALILWGIGLVRAWAGGSPPAVPDPLIRSVLAVTFTLLAWRLCIRAGFVGHAYGPGEALLSIPRAAVGNLIALIAARRALFRYIATLRGARAHWDKTAHRFPASSDLPEPQP
jgi:adsorption protein B